MNLNYKFIDYLFKVLTCILILAMVFYKDLSFFIIIPAAVLIYLVDEKVLKKDNNYVKDNKFSVYVFLIETSSLAYLSSLFNEYSFVFKFILCTFTCILILFEYSIKKINVFNKVISKDLIGLPILILFLMSLPK